MENYRPLAISACYIDCVKNYGKIDIYQYDYLINSNIVSNSQHGLRPCHSTTTALLGITNRWYQNMDAGQLNGVVFRDLKKAFDTVDHDILL